MGVVLLFSIALLILYKRHSSVSHPIPLEMATRETPDVLGSESPNQIVLYDDKGGVTLGANLNGNLTPQVNVTVDGKTVSKPLPSLGNTTNALGIIGAFFVNGWTKFTEFVSTILDTIIS